MWLRYTGTTKTKASSYANWAPHGGAFVIQCSANSPHEVPTGACFMGWAKAVQKLCAVLPVAGCGRPVRAQRGLPIVWQGFATGQWRGGYQRRKGSRCTSTIAGRCGVALQGVYGVSAFGGRAAARKTTKAHGVQRFRNLCGSTFAQHCQQYRQGGAAHAGKAACHDVAWQRVAFLRHTQRRRLILVFTNFA